MKNVLITGGSSGIGFATAQLFLSAQDQVWITGRDEVKLQQAATHFASDRLHTLQADTSILSEIDRLAADFEAEQLKLDVVFLNAGIATFAPMAEATEAQFDAQFNTNVKAVYFSIQKLVPHLNPGASIIINGSTSATASGMGSSIYAATKAAVIKIAKIAANEYAHLGIRVNIVSPGPTLTAGLIGAVPADALGSLAANVALQRLADPAEIAQVVSFLASDASSFITGTELIVDGGLLNYTLK